MNHPCQALADWKTMDDLGVPRNGEVRAVVGLSSARAAAGRAGRGACTWPRMRGMEVVVLRPEGYALPPEIMDKARSAAAQLPAAPCARPPIGATRSKARTWCMRRSGARPRTTATPKGTARLRAGLTDWCVRNDWFANAASDCRLMHCLPVRRNTAVADEVLDGPRSVVQREAYNRLTVQMAVLYKLLKGS